MRYHFLSVYSSAVLPEVDVINRFYNERVYPRDTEGRCYRKIIIGTKHEMQSVTYTDKDKQNDLKEFNVVEAKFYQKLCSAYANSELIVLKDNHINNLEQIINVKEAQVKELEQAMQLKDDHINNIEENLRLKDDHIKNIEASIQVKDDYIQNIGEDLKLKDNHIKNIEAIIKAKDDYIKNTELILGEKENHICNIEQAIKLKDNHIKNIEDLLQQDKNEIQLKDNHINNISTENKALNDEIERLRGIQEEYRNELDAIYSTLVGKVLRKLVNRKR